MQPYIEAAILFLLSLGAKKVLELAVWSMLRFCYNFFISHVSRFRPRAKMAIEETNNKPETIRSIPEVVADVLAMGHDPLSKKNSSGLDYVAPNEHDTYEFINPKQFDLKGRSVFITGASRGIGKAFAISYAKAGVSNIGIGARSSLEQVEKEILEAAKNAGRAAPKVLALKLDVTSKESVANAAKETEKAFGGLDILVNNAGFLSEYLHARPGL